MSHRRIAVIGLGYVGLPLALAFAKKFDNTIGFDINPARVAALKAGSDVTKGGLEKEISSSSLTVTDNADDLKAADFFVVGVPTPIDSYKRPDLLPLQKACELIAPRLSKGDVIVFESTVYPGLTEEFCAPLLESHSGLRAGVDFKLGYSPERINPGDKEHTLEKIVKVVAGQDLETLDIVTAVYEPIIEAGVHRAPSIRVAEAAKVIENTQRDLNIALMNELAIIFGRMGIRTADVLEAAGTKWNFLPFRPGLVGGHCIGVDPYYLTSKAEKLGYRPQVILAGRRINDGMGAYVAQQVVKIIVNAGRSCKGARVGVLGVTFKENVSDIRNSRVPDILAELKEFGIDAMITDPLADADETFEEYGLKLTPISECTELDVLILAVNHRVYLDLTLPELVGRLTPGGLFVDVKSVFAPEEVPAGYQYWSL